MTGVLERICQSGRLAVGVGRSISTKVGISFNRMKENHQTATRLAQMAVAEAARKAQKTMLARTLSAIFSAKLCQSLDHLRANSMYSRTINELLASKRVSLQLSAGLEELRRLQTKITSQAFSRIRTYPLERLNDSKIREAVAPA